MSQLANIAATISLAIGPSEDWLRMLNTQLEITQNPGLSHVDGSVTEVKWNAAKQVLLAARDLEKALACWNEVKGG